MGDSDYDDWHHFVLIVAGGKFWWTEIYTGPEVFYLL